MSTITAGPVAEQSSPEIFNNSELQRLRKRLRRMAQKILPEQPYILQIFEKTTPDLARHDLTWSKGTPFSYHEDVLQYATFMNVPLELGVVISFGGWENGKGEIDDSSDNGPRTFQSGTTTPKPGQKKMSLADYAKRKTAGQSGQSGVKAVRQSVAVESTHVKVNDTQVKLSDKVVEVNNVTLTVTDKKDIAMDPTHTQSKIGGAHGQASQLPNKVDDVRPKVDSIQDQTKVVQGKVDIVKAPSEKASMVEVSSQISKKRPIAAMTESKPSNSTIQNSGVEQPQKKLRTSPPPQAQSKPEFQPTNVVVPKLPKLLSPTLPTTVEEVLAKLPDSSKPEAGALQSVKNTTVTSSTSSKALIPHQPSSSQLSQDNQSKPGPSSDVRKDTPTSKTVPDNASVNKAKVLSTQTQLSSRDVTKDAHDKIPQVNGAATTHLTVSASQNSRKEHVSSISSSASTTNPEARKSKIVIFKFRKSLQKDFARLVKVSESKTRPDQTQPPKGASKALVAEAKKLERNTTAKSNKDSSQGQPDKRSATEHQAKPLRPETGKSIVEGSRSTGKHARTEDDQDAHRGLSKRQKQTSTGDLPQKPSTPIPPSFKSPSVSAHGSSQKVQENNKAMYSRRLEAGEVDVKTPQGSTRAGTPTAPHSIDKANRDGRSASNTSIVSALSNKSDEMNAWKVERTKYMRLGRDLKHDADALFRLCEGNDDAQLEKQAIATGIETILCFMLGYALVDEVQGRSSRKIIDTANWTTIFGFLHRVKVKASGHTLLHGLCRQLEAVCLSIITASDLERLAQAELPNATALDAEKAKADNADYMKLKSKIAEQCRNAHQLWIEGAFELSVEDLQNSFPHSWSRKARAPLAKAREKLTPGSLDGDFYLPMSGITTGIEAVRAGWALLCEWSMKDKVKWQAKFSL